MDRHADDECWPWRAFVSPDGYGHFRLNSRTTTAHRVAYHLTHGIEIPPGFEVDHVCFNRACCNPAHLQLLTTSENRSRSQRYVANKCYRGHDLTDDNLYGPNLRLGKRACLICRRASNAARADHRAAS
ncbi:MAG: HNH endonuclease signature motif containing protein [Candidatus Nanopelagicales bacterium]